MRSQLVISIVLLLTGSIAHGADVSQLELRIGNVRGLVGVGTDDMRNQLSVVLTNRSDSEVKIYDQWNSWGYGTLSFTIEMENGEKKTLRRFNGIVWSGNGPDEVTLKPGDQYVFSVWLKHKEDRMYSNSWGPLRISNGDFPDVKLQAHYASKSGPISSKPVSLRLQDQFGLDP